jgi:hypothetical protein
MLVSCKVRDLLKVPREDILNIKSDVKVTFEDNVDVIYNYKELIVLRYLLTVFEKYDNIPIVSKYDFKNYYEEVKSGSGTSNFYSKSTLRKWYSVFYSDIDMYYIDTKLADRTIFINVGSTIWTNISDIYDDIVCGNLNYSDTINIESFVELQINARLLTAMEECIKVKTTESIKNVYDTLDDVINNDPTLVDNIVARGYRVGSLKTGSVKQLVGPIGNVSEVTSTIYNKPITSSYVMGMNDEYEAILETRKAAIANIESTETIRSSEYFAREMQLATMFLESIIDTDCGSTEYLEWYIDPSNKKYFTTLMGKYYLNPVTNQLDYIKPTDTHLIGTTIQLRSILYCKLPNLKHVCSKCFGKLANNINISTNLGHFSSVELTELISQGVLSTKHLITSANSNNIPIKENTKGWMFTMLDIYGEDEKKIQKQLNKDDDSSKYVSGVIYLRPINKADVKDLDSLLLVIENNNKLQLANLQVLDLEKVDVNKLSDIKEFTLRFKSNNGIKMDGKIEINNVVKYKSPFKFTKQFLKYVQSDMSNISIVNNEIRINILPYITNTKQGRKMLSIFKYQPTEFRFGTLISEEKNMYRIGGKKGEKIHPSEFLRNAYELTNRKLSLNLSLIEAIMYSYIVNDSIEIGDYRLSRATNDSYVTKTQNVVRYRTIGSAYGWDDIQHKVLFIPMVYLDSNKVSSVMDVLFTPNDILNKKK